MFRRMWQRPLRCLASLFVVLAFLGGTTMQAMPLDNPSLMATMGTAMPGCAAMAMDHSDAPAQKGLTPSCVKLMQCLGVPVGPTRVSLAAVPIRYAAVTYWPVAQHLDGVSLMPSPFPPKST